MNTFDKIRTQDNESNIADQTLMPKVVDMRPYLKLNLGQTQWSESFGERRLL